MPDAAAHSVCRLLQTCSAACALHSQHVDSNYLALPHTPGLSVMLLHTKHRAAFGSSQNSGDQLLLTAAVSAGLAALSAEFCEDAT